MIALRMDPNKQNNVGNGALHRAIANSNLVFYSLDDYLIMVRRILNDPRTNLDLKNNLLETPFDVAVRHYYHHILKYTYMKFDESFKAVDRGVREAIREFVKTKKERSDSNDINLSEKYY